MNFNQILADTLRFEGGETVDSGGVTNRGITQKTYDSYAASKGKPSKSVNELSFGDAKNLYYDEYFVKPKIDKIPSEKVAAITFDFGVNSGTVTAIKALQEAVGAKADGVIGKKTLASMDKYIAKYGEEALADAVMTKRENLMSNLIMQNPEKYGAYEKGWSNRTKALRQKYLLPNL